jgi:hypothetical protein
MRASSFGDFAVGGKDTIFPHPEGPWVPRMVPGHRVVTVHLTVVDGEGVDEEKADQQEVSYEEGVGDQVTGADSQT